MSYICTVGFADGWKVGLQSLFCQATYAGHLEGPITARKNDGLLRRMKAKANDLFGEKPVFVVEPQRTMGRAIEGYEFEGKPVHREMLPPVCCIGDFQGDAVANEDGCASALIVIWFQAVPPPVPIEPQIADLMYRVPWNERAINFWF